MSGYGSREAAIAAVIPVIWSEGEEGYSWNVQALHQATDGRIFLYVDEGCSCDSAYEDLASFTRGSDGQWGYEPIDEATIAAAFQPITEVSEFLSALKRLSDWSRPTPAEIVEGTRILTEALKKRKKA